ncbi:class I SAM-dependent methyltransferase [Nakamurella sp. A5-74]|uniref:Class I SAM-dependent methyltransferase n=1 Tax=Nakamurella sp. A5-74 TaxID=3158264 RepID=A0AAU8DMX4_9ACTN
MDGEGALERTRQDYDTFALAYDAFIRNDVSHARTIGTAMVTALAELVRANGSLSPVLDAGCGPGHWTALLVELGTPAYGMDLSPAMVAIARGRRPDVRFEIGSVLELSDADSSVGGILAHFSLIHLPPPLVDAALAEFARVAEPGAPLLVGVQITDDAHPDGWVRYGHPVSAAYRWNLDALSARLRRSGFAELVRLRMEGSSADKPPAGYLLARHRP